jgi:hypothetical protein
MCHEWWQRRMREEREASRELWEEFERTRPLSDPERADEEHEVRLENPDAKPLVAER